MKIVISTFDDLKNPYYGGGGAIAIHQVAKRLAKFHEIKILSGKYPNCYFGEIDGVKYQHIGFSRINPKFNQLIFQTLLPYYAKTLNYDIWIESFTPPFSTAFIPSFTTKPVIGLTHLLAAESKEKEYGLPFEKIEQIGLKKYKNFIVLTNSVKKKIRKYNSKAKIEVIPNGIDNSKIKNVKKIGNKHILFIGRIDINQKGLDLLLDSYSLLREDVNIPLIIAGDGDKKDIKALKHKISVLELRHRVKLPGKVAGKRKESLYENSSLVVMPSRFETLPLTALEAMAHNRPLLVFNIDGFDWLPKNCSVKVKPFNTVAYSLMLKQIIQDTTLRKKLGQNSKRFTKMLDWDLISGKYLNFIEKIEKERKVRSDENPNHSRLFAT